MTTFVTIFLLNSCECLH